MFELVGHQKYSPIPWTGMTTSFFVWFSDFFFRYILSPFGKSLGIKSTRSKRATPNPILEAAYNNCSRIHHKTVSWRKMLATCKTRNKSNNNCNYTPLFYFIIIFVVDAFFQTIPPVMALLMLKIIFLKIVDSRKL